MSTKPRGRRQNPDVRQNVCWTGDSALCQRCGHHWNNHTDAESLEDPSVGHREPCRYDGCPCDDYVYVRQNPGDHGDERLRRLERARASGDHQAALALHAERYRRGLPFLPDVVHPEQPGGSMFHDRWDEYYLTASRGVAAFNRTTQAWREHVAALANEGSSSARRRPVITAESPRDTLIRWLEWNDSNGCYSDADCEIEGMDPLNEFTVWDAVGESVGLERPAFVNAVPGVDMIVLHLEPRGGRMEWMESQEGGGCVVPYADLQAQLRRYYEDFVRFGDAQVWA